MKLLLTGLCCLWLGMMSTIAQAEPNHEMGQGSIELIQAFQGEKELNRYSVTSQTRHEILFGMGLSLLTLVLSTAGLGLGMVLAGKPWFVPHMICAGLSVTLAIAHSVVAMVWFWPF